jgi:hypothetical protein
MAQTRISGKALQNPFRIHGTVGGEYFTDRKDELAKFRAILEEPAAKMLVYGHRRMGKSSTLELAVDSVNRTGGHALLADLSTASTFADISNRILSGAARSMGKRWGDLISDWVKMLKGSVSLKPDPLTGALLPSFDVSIRTDTLERQRETLTTVLDSLNSLAKKKKMNVGLVLDEFQEITRFGGESAEWHLRGVIQSHQNVSYIFAGSKEHIIRAMLEKGRAFYRMLDEYHFAPIERQHMAAWIDERLASVSLKPQGAGESCVRLAGPRTRDIVQVARKCVDRSEGHGAITYNEIAEAYVEIIDDMDDSIRTWWNTMTRQQQNVLRAVAGSGAGLTTRETRRRFSLGGSGTPTNAASSLLKDGHLVRTDNGSGYVFDSPFVRGWVIIHALPDMGLALLPTHIASETSEYQSPKVKRARSSLQS